MSVDDFLVGYKWMGEYVGKMEDSKNFIFSFENTCGYCRGDFIRDKGGDIGAVTAAEMVSYLKDQGKTLRDYLNEIYEKAECFVLPSLYEGFGLPVLEAMAHSIPVVVSNTSSLPEIAGKAGIYVDPENIESIAEGITTALSENSKAREIRITLGKARVKEFTWKKAADSVMEVLLSVSKKGVS